MPYASLPLFLIAYSVDLDISSDAKASETSEESDEEAELNKALAMSSGTEE